MSLNYILYKLYKYRFPTILVMEIKKKKILPKKKEKVM